MMLEIVLGVSLFTAIILALVLVILLARSRLVPSGSVRIEFEGHPDKGFEAQAGGKLLAALNDAGIFLPSACGGSGICGQCRVQVLAGAGEILPTEKEFFTKREITQGFRLACQVGVRQPLQIEVPPAVFSARRRECEVVSNHNVATFIKELVLRLPAGDSLDFEPGSYVQIEVPPHHVEFSDFDIDEVFRDDWTKSGLWQMSSSVDEPVMRAYTMANYPGEQYLKFNIRIALPPGNALDIPPGKMSSYLFSLKAGDALTIFGPFGEFFPSSTEAEMIYVGGGSGMAPMRSHIFHLLEQHHTRRQISYWYGARSVRELFYVEDFERLQAQHENFRWHIALSDPLPEDHWQGDVGFIHEVLFECYLKDHPAPEECEYYLCGPPPMLRAMRRLLKDLGVDEENIFLDDFNA